jgi:hypothetical protein
LGIINAFIYEIDKIYRGRKFRKMYEEINVGNIEGDDQNFRGDLCLYISIGFRIIVTTKVHSCAANVERSIKEADSFIPWSNRRPTIAA